MARMTDVARMAGVSISTVPYAMTGARPITAQTRQRVEHAVEQLDERTHVLAEAGVEFGIIGHNGGTSHSTSPMRTSTNAAASP